MLGDLFTKHDSDKNREHSYGPMYDRLLTPMKDRVTDFLEVGVLGGASLRAWVEYFGPGVKVVGMDTWEKAGPAPGATILRANSTDPASTDAALGQAMFDVIVEDGSHYGPDQRATFENLWDRVKPGGLYVIEDVQHEATVREFESMGGEFVDLRKIKNRFDDMVIVFRKPEDSDARPGQPELATRPVE